MSIWAHAIKKDDEFYIDGKYFNQSYSSIELDEIFETLSHHINFPELNITLIPIFVLSYNIWIKGVEHGVDYHGSAEILYQPVHLDDTDELIFLLDNTTILDKMSLLFPRVKLIEHEIQHADLMIYNGILDVTEQKINDNSIIYAHVMLYDIKNKNEH